MATTLVNFRLDTNVKTSLDYFCENVGLSLSSLFTIFAKRVAREQKIPFELKSDPFYSEENMAFIKEGIKALNEGKGVEHELIEA